MDHISVQKVCDKCATIDTYSYPVKSLIDLGKFLMEEGETFKHTCTPLSEDIPVGKPIKQEKEEAKWSCPNCNTLLEQKAIVCPSCHGHVKVAGNVAKAVIAEARGVDLSDAHEHYGVVPWISGLFCLFLGAPVL